GGGPPEAGSPARGRAAGGAPRGGRRPGGALPLLPRTAAARPRRAAAAAAIRAGGRGAVPPSDPPGDVGPAAPPTAELPRIPGYEVEGELGRGGGGVGYRARQGRLNPTRPPTMLPGRALAGRHERARFQREAELVAGLRHPNLVQVHEVAELDGRPYFTMEYVEGGSLADAIAGTPRPARQAAELVATLAEAIAAAHRGG